MEVTRPDYPGEEIRAATTHGVREMAEEKGPGAKPGSKRPKRFEARVPTSESVQHPPLREAKAEMAKPRTDGRLAETITRITGEARRIAHRESQSMRHAGGGKIQDRNVIKEHENAEELAGSAILRISKGSCANIAEAHLVARNRTGRKIARGRRSMTETAERERLDTLSACLHRDLRPTGGLSE